MRQTADGKLFHAERIKLCELQNTLRKQDLRLITVEEALEARIKVFDEVWPDMKLNHKAAGTLAHKLFDWVLTSDAVARYGDTVKFARNYDLGSIYPRDIDKNGFVKLTENQFADLPEKNDDRSLQASYQRMKDGIELFVTFTNEKGVLTNPAWAAFASARALSDYYSGISRVCRKIYQEGKTRFFDSMAVMCVPCGKDDPFVNYVARCDPMRGSYFSERFPAYPVLSPVEFDFVNSHRGIGTFLMNEGINTGVHQAFAVRK
jgi:hypothetical protein